MKRRTQEGWRTSVGSIGVSGFTHGTGYLDTNGFIHYTPTANYFGATQFNYTLKAANDAMHRRVA